MTEKQKIFADEYLIDLNATRAYRVAYPRVKKNEVAAVNGSRMLRNAKVETYIQERMEERSKRTEIKQDWVLEELRKIASVNGSDFAKVVTRDGISMVEMVPTDTLPEEKRAAISSIKKTNFGISVETYDRVRALELLGRHLGMFKEKVELSGLQEEKSKLDDLIRQMRGDG
jgi:phage terminase small subunit